MLPFTPRHIILAFILPLVVYMSLYTWNWETGHIDRIARYSGLEFVGYVLAPGKWLHRRVESLWSSYVQLRRVHQENSALRDEIQELNLQIMRLQKQAKEAVRLRELMHFSPPPDWGFQGADVIGSQIGPNAVLHTLMINKGRQDRIAIGTPILTADGIVGRVNQVSSHFSTILLITDPNSNIPVRGRQSRTNGILSGQGSHNLLQVKHVPQNAKVYNDEILVTSGLAGLFPEGLPVAKVTQVAVTDLSLFKQISAQPLVDIEHLEEVLVLFRRKNSHNTGSERKQ